MRSKISALVAKLLPKNLYSRFTLITVATVITWYAIIYAYTNLPTQTSGNPLTATIWNDVVNKVNDIWTRTDWITSVWGNIGIGTASPVSKFTIADAQLPTITLKETTNNKTSMISTSYSNGSYITNALAWDLILLWSSGVSIAWNNTNPAIRINNSNNVWIWTTNPNAKLSIANNISAGWPAGSYWSYQLMLFDSATPNASYWLGISNGTLWLNSNVYYDFYVAWTKVANIGTNWAYTQLSDRRYKTNINTLTWVLDKINNLNWVSFNWKRNWKKDIWVIAQDVERVFPEAVVTDEKWMKSVAYGNLVAPLIEAVKELKSKNDKLEERIMLLESR